MKIKNKKRELFIAKYFVFLIVLFIGVIIFWISEGFDSIINLFSVLVGIFCPLFVIVYLLNLVFNKTGQRRNLLIVTINAIMAIGFFIFVMNAGQRQMFLVIDGILGFLIASLYVFKRLLN